jgi:two-component system, OmpR family, response regulator
MVRPRILVVEDDAAIASGLVRGLRQEGFDVELLSTGADVVRRVTSEPFDAVVLDLMLPDESGFDILEGLRHRSSVPVVVLTARTEVDDRVRSFDLGAADYVSKPFWVAELVARLRARMLVSKTAPNRVVTFGVATVDFDAREVSVDGRPAEMTRTEFDVLAYLVQRPGRAVSRDQLAEDVLPGIDDARTVDAHVAKVRRKLGAAAARIVTVWGIGYRFEPGEP